MQKKYYHNLFLKRFRKASNAMVVGRVFVLIIFFMPACNTRNPDKVEQFIQDTKHGLRQEKTINGVEIRVTYRPQDFLVHQEVKAKPAITETEIKSLQQQYGKQLYFILSLSHNNQEILNAVAANQAQFSGMVTRLAFEMGNHVSLVNSKGDTLAFIDAVFPRTYGMATSSDILLAFKNMPEKKSVEWLKLTIYDLGLQTGDVSFKFDWKNIQKVSK